MQRRMGAALVALGLVAAVPAMADNTSVDLRGKQGVVDPAQLKKDNPQERGLHVNEPPAPQRDKPTGQVPNPPPNGNLQGPNNAAPVRAVPLPGRVIP